MKEKEARRAAREAKRRRETESDEASDKEPESETEKEQPTKKKKTMTQRSLAEFVDEDKTATVNDTEQLALYLLSK